MKHMTALLALALLATLLPAQESQFDYSVSPRFWGATVGGRYALEPPAPDTVETSIVGYLSGAYESVGYYRAPDFSLFTDGDAGFPAEAANFNRLDTWWQLGIQQGILPRSDVSDDLAVVFAYYRGRYDLPFPDPDNPDLFDSSTLPGADGSLLGSVHAGLAFSNIVDAPIVKTRRGILTELVLQWGPSFLHNSVIGSASFTRTTLSARGFLPIFVLPPRNDKNVFSSYLAAFAALDWATGPDIPMEVRSTFGLRSERAGLGGSVRGFESRRFDATLKAVANVEVRMNLPAIVLPGLIPGLLIYTDAGYFSDLDQLSPVAEEQSGTLFSSGGGFYLDVLDIAEFVFYTNYLWDPASIEGKHWMPFSLGFGFHF